MSAPRRRKTAKACQSCRKMKARCEPSTEIAGEDALLPCHRCQTLQLICQFEGQQPIKPIESSAQALQLQARKLLSNFENPLPITFQNEKLTIKQLSVTQWFERYNHVRFYCRQNQDERWIAAVTFPSSVCSTLIARDPTAKQRTISENRIATTSQLHGGEDWKAQMKINHPSETKGSVPLAEVVAILDSDLEYQLMSIFAGLYSPLLPCLSLGEQVPTSLHQVVTPSASDSFFLASIYLTAVPHLTEKDIVSKLQPLLRKAVDKFTRKNIKSMPSENSAILALFIVSKFILFPKDELSKDPRPKAVGGLDDGLLEYSEDLSPRLVIRTARKMALDLGLHRKFSSTEIADREAFQGSTGDIRDSFRKELFQAALWLGLKQADHSIDVIQGLQDRLTFEKEYNHNQQISAPLSSQSLPPLDFLPAQEQLRLIWIVRRSELFAMASEYKREWDEMVPSLKDEAALSRKVHEPAKKIAHWISGLDESFGKIASDFELNSSVRRHLSLLSDIAHIEAYSIRAILADSIIWPLSRSVEFGGKGDDGSTLMLPQVFSRGNASLPGYLLMEFCGMEGLQNCEKVVSIAGSSSLLPVAGDEELVDSSATFLPFPTLGSLTPDLMVLILHAFIHMIETQVSVADSWAIQLHDAQSQTSILTSLIRGVDALRKEITVNPFSQQALKFTPMTPRCDSTFQSLKHFWSTWQAEKRIRFSGGGAIQTETFKPPSLPGAPDSRSNWDQKISPTFDLPDSPSHFAPTFGFEDVNQNLELSAPWAKGSQPQDWTLSDLAHLGSSAPDPSIESSLDCNDQNQPHPFFSF